MRVLWPSTTLLVSLLTASAAPAATTLGNVSGFDPTLLAGKTCQGAFTTGKKHETSMGALQLRFAISGNVLSAHLWRLLGQAAYDQAAYALSQPAGGIEQHWFDDLGEVRGLSVTGNEVRYIDPQGARVQLAYERGRLNGQSDPRGQPIPGMTRLAFVRMICR